MTIFMEKDYVRGNTNLIKLANFLSNLDDNKWNYRVIAGRYDEFGEFVDMEFDTPEEFYQEMVSGCGTVGCALGYCPVALPEYFSYSKEGEILENNAPLDQDSVFKVGMVPFALTRTERGHLFYEHGYHYSLDDVPRSEVIERIYNLVKDHEEFIRVYDIQPAPREDECCVEWENSFINNDDHHDNEEEVILESDNSSELVLV